MKKQNIIDQIEGMTQQELVTLNNDYCDSAGYGDDLIYSNDEEFFNDHFSDNPLSAVRAAVYGDYNYTDNWVKYNGYGNLETISSMDTDKLVNSLDSIAEYVKENISDFTYKFQ